jgi:serine/threonine-protein kinase
LLFGAFDQVSRVPGSTRARAMLAQSGLRYLDALAADETAPVDVRVEAGLGFVRLAQVVGGGQNGSLGRFADANDLLARAATILLPLRRAHPDDPAVRQAVAALLLEVSGVDLYNNNQAARARTRARQAQALLAPIAARDIDTARTFATAIQAEGDSYGWDDDYAAARPVHARAEAFIAGLPAAYQADPRIMGARSANLRLLAEASHKVQDEPAARAAIDQAVAFNRTLVASAPDDPALVRKLSMSLWYSAVLYRTAHQDPQARAAIAESVARAADLRTRDPSDAGAQALYALVAEVEAQVLADLGRVEESYQAGERVMAMRRILVAAAGATPGARRSMASSLRTHAANSYNGRQYARACTAWRESVAILTALDASGDLTDLDRNNSLPEQRSYLARACDGPGGPRGGLPEAP